MKPNPLSILAALTVVGLMAAAFFLLRPSQQQLSEQISQLINQQKSTLTKSDSDAVLVYTNLGDSFHHQFYIWTSIEQSRKFNPNLEIYLILSKKAVSPEVRNKILQYRLRLFFYDEASDPIIDEFKSNFFIQGNMVPIDGNTNFVQYTTERLIYIYVLMKNLGLKNVFHMENDNLLYINLNELLKSFQACKLNFGVPFAAKGQAVVSVLFIRDEQYLKDFIQYVISIFKMGRQKAQELLHTSYINDMTITYAYFVDKRGDIAELPDKFYKRGENCIWDNAKIIIDACVLGQWFAGTHTNPSGHHYEDNRLVDPRQSQLVWKNSKFGFKELYLRNAEYGEIRVVNMHIHSKELEKYISKQND